jgi:hypothetical protein
MNKCNINCRNTHKIETQHQNVKWSCQCNIQRKKKNDLLWVEIATTKVATTHNIELQHQITTLGHEIKTPMQQWGEKKGKAIIEKCCYESRHKHKYNILYMIDVETQRGEK